MKKNGFTIYECVVAVGIVVLLSAIIASTCFVVGMNQSKTKCLHVGLNELQNITKIYEQSEISVLGEVSYSDLQDKIKSFYDNHGTTTIDENGLTFEVCFNDKYEFIEQSNNKILVAFNKVDDVVVMQGSIEYKEQILYQNENILQRWLWWEKIKSNLVLFWRIQL